MAQGITANLDNSIEESQIPSLTGLSAETVRRAADFLLDSCRIGNVRSHYLKCRRYAPLRWTSIYPSLVGLYEQLFTSQWHIFRRLVDSFILPSGVKGARYAARVYVSHWIHDLYCSNRDATRNVSPTAHNEHFFEDRASYSMEYDEFLVLLDASIRPTNIKLISEDSLWIPIFKEDKRYAWTSTDSNFFGITDYQIHDELFYGLLDMMRERKDWRLVRRASNTVGRPCWLLDWHAEDTACAWFPREQNYTDNDVVLAYIIGVACTPKLAPRDFDDWQFIPQGLNPSDEHLLRQPRVNPRTFYGSYEVHAVERGLYKFPEVLLNCIENVAPDFAKKRKASKGRDGSSAGTLVIGDSSTAEPSSETTQTSTPDLPELMRYRLLTYVYYSKVISFTESHTRIGAHKMIVMG